LERLKQKGAAALANSRTHLREKEDHVDYLDYCFNKKSDW
jgi:hypothetical protein